MTGAQGAVSMVAAATAGGMERGHMAGTRMQEDAWISGKTMWMTRPEGRTPLAPEGRDTALAHLGMDPPPEWPTTQRIPMTIAGQLTQTTEAGTGLTESTPCLTGAMQTCILPGAAITRGHVGSSLAMGPSSTMTEAGPDLAALKPAASRISGGGPEAMIMTGEGPGEPPKSVMAATTIAMAGMVVRAWTEAAVLPGGVQVRGMAIKTGTRGTDRVQTGDRELEGPGTGLRSAAASPREKLA